MCKCLFAYAPYRSDSPIIIIQGAGKNARKNAETQEETVLADIVRIGYTNCGEIVF